MTVLRGQRPQHPVGGSHEATGDPHSGDVGDLAAALGQLWRAVLEPFVPFVSDQADKLLAVTDEVESPPGGQLLFIDDAGDPGFKFARASSQFFVIACVVFDTHLAAEAAAERIRRFRASKGWNTHYELKFNKLRKDYLEELLESLVTCDFRIRAVVVDKMAVQSHELKSRPNSFYNYIIKELLARDDSLVEVSVRLDGHADKAYRRQAVAYFRREVNKGSRKIAKLRYADSAQNDLIQLADLVAGSIYRSRQADKTDHEDYIKTLKPRVEDIWDFG